MSNGQRNFFVGVCWIILALISLIAVECAHAQAFVGSGIIIQSGLGYKAPSPYFRAGYEHTGKHIFATGYSEFQMARKIETNDGHFIGGSFLAAFKEKNVFIGGGAIGGNQYTSQWSKGSIKPMIAGGFDNQYVRVTGYGKFAGTDDRNASKSVGALAEFKIQNWRIEYEWEIVNFHYTDVPAWKYTRPRNRIGVKYVFAKRNRQ